jgi:hypothetical protein
MLNQFLRPGFCIIDEWFAQTTIIGRYLRYRIIIDDRLLYLYIYYMLMYVHQENYIRLARLAPDRARRARLP